MSYPPDPNEAKRLAAHAVLQAAARIPDETADRITAFAAQHFGVRTCLVTLVESERQLFLSRHGFEATETPRTLSFCAHAILRPEVLVVEDARRDPRFQNNLLVTGLPHIRFYAGASLVYREETRIGTLCLIDYKPRKLSLGERAELEMLADAAMGVIMARALGLPEPDLTGAFAI
jgi:GAF domain-containing protein